jgi:regulator of sigma E protease
MPPIAVTVLGFACMLALLVFVHRLARRVSKRRLLAIMVGAFAGYLICAILFFVAMVGYGREEMTLRVSVVPSEPADEAGMREGDRLVALNGTRLSSFDELRLTIRESGDSPIELEVDREGESLRFNIQPRDGRIGISPIVERHALPIGITAATAAPAPMFALVERAQALVGPRKMMGPVAIIERPSSLWPLLFRLGELGSYAWPLSILIAFMQKSR